MLRQWFNRLLKTPRRRKLFLTVMMLAFGTAYALSPGESEGFQFFAPLGYPTFEIAAIFVVLVIAILGLGYALLLVKQVRAADQGTPKMQEIAAAVREGANAYLAAQFKRSRPSSSSSPSSSPSPTPAASPPSAGAAPAPSWWARSSAGPWVRRHAAGHRRQPARRRRRQAELRRGHAARLPHRHHHRHAHRRPRPPRRHHHLPLYGDQAYEALLGFGFGGTLLALFMRVGGGIYTKAADVGADLVGKIEKDIPEDDPRNAATIADNVGDNVGDCAGMAADIFESYEVTIVAAMILGMATFGHKGVIFPLLVRGIGVLGSIISTYTVKAGPNDTSDTALKSVHRGFWIGSVISVIGFFVLGASTCTSTPATSPTNPMAVRRLPRR